MNLKPIRSDKDHQRALEQIEMLWGAPLKSREGDDLEILITLVEAYEKEHYPIDLPDPLAAIRFRLEQMGKDLRSLVGIIGHRSRVYEVMRGDRPLSLQMIRKLHRELGIPAEVLIQPVSGRQRTRRRGTYKSTDFEQGAAEFRRLSGRGDSRGWRFNREEVHERR